MPIQVSEDQLLDVMAAVVRLETKFKAYVHVCVKCAGLFRKSATAHGKEAYSIPAAEDRECFFCYDKATEYYQVARPGHINTFQHDKRS